jgi:hypothetical protein
MSLEMVCLPEVSRNFVKAFAFCEALSLRAALNCEEAFGRAEAEVEEDLLTHQRAFDHDGRVFVGNFPYNPYYRLDGARAVIGNGSKERLASASGREGESKGATVEMQPRAWKRTHLFP